MRSFSLKRCYTKGKNTNFAKSNTGLFEHKTTIMIDLTESGPIIGEYDGATESETYSNIQPIAIHSHYRLWKAMRYGRWFLLKGISSGYLHDETHRQLLLKEFSTLMRLQHPGVVQAISFEDVRGVGPCIVMEYIEGKTLGEWIDEGADLNRCRDILHQLLDTVEYIHQAGIVHRDLKPSNIMISRIGNRVKVIDFGLADADYNTLFKHAAGTDGYISPEQAAGSKPDVRNDIFSLGAILHDMQPLTGERYQAVMKRCQGPIDGRYASVEMLRRALDRADAVRHWLAHGTAIVLIAVAAVALLYYFWPRGAMEIITTADGALMSKEPDTVTHVAPAPLEAMPIESTPTPAPTAPPATPTNDRDALVQAAINEGNRRVKAGYPSAALNHHLDTLTNLIYLNQDLLLGGAQIVNSYIEEIKPRFNDREVTEIYNSVYYTNYKIFDEVNKRLDKVRQRQ